MRTLKQKRSHVIPLIARPRKQFDVAAAETGHLDLRGRAVLGLAVVAGDLHDGQQVLDGCERWLVAQPQVELVALTTAYVGDEEME